MDNQEVQETLNQAILSVSSISITSGHRMLLDDDRILPQLEALFWEDPSGSKDPIRGDLHREVSEIPNLPHDPLDPSARTVIAMLLYYAAVHARGIWAWGGDDEDDVEAQVEQARDGVFRFLRTYLDRVPTRDITDQQDYLWELQAAGAARHGGRVLALCTSLLAERPDTETLLLVSRCIYWTLNRGGSELHPQQFAPYDVDDSVMSDAWDTAAFVTALAAVSDCLENALNQIQRSHPPDSKERDDALALLNLCLERLDDQVGLSRILCAVRGWCLLEQAIARQDPATYLNAAVHFKRALGSGLPILDERILSVVAGCELFGRRADLAEQTLLERVNVAENKSQANRQLARCYHLQGKLEQSVLALERAVGQEDKENEDSWIETIALQAGTQLVDQSRMLRALGRAALRAKIRPQAENLIAWLNPTFASLCTAAQSDWWTGLYSLSSPEALAGLGDEQCLRTAAEKFGEALNHEIKHRVLRPFLTDSSALVDQARRREYQWPDKDVLLDRGPLGTNLIAILGSGNTPLAKSLSAWLIAKRPKLRSYLATSNDRRSIEAIPEIRNRAVHGGGTVTRGEVRKVFDVCARFLEVLTKEGITNS